MSETSQPLPVGSGFVDPPRSRVLSKPATSTVYHRIAGVALLFIAEFVAITVWLRSLDHTAVFNRLLQGSEGWAPRAIVTYVSVVLGYLWAKSVLREVGSKHGAEPVRRAFLAGHFCALASFVLLTRFLFSGRAFGPWTNPIDLARLILGLLAATLGALAFLPLETWSHLLRGAGRASAYATVAAVIASRIDLLAQARWGLAVQATFFIVKFLLGFFFSPVISDPATATIGSPSFKVIIDTGCSGLEGIALMLVFGIVWLWLFRQELRFPQAILMAPVSLAAGFLLNSVRIAALILIGNAGAPAIALGGFHSQAGWIGFNAVALGLMIGSQHIPWLAARQAQPTPAGSRADNPAAVYLAPFMAILAAGMLSRALTGRFEWLYPLRLCAVAAVLWRYRKEYAQLDWACDWLGPAAGAVVFALWIALDRLAVSSSPGGAVAAFTPGHGAAWIAWLAFRTLGAVAAVPIAEELAFRGFLLRRLNAADFDRIPFRNTSLVALLVSSLAFGLMHGVRWFAGSLAGLAYALVARRRGRIGEAIAAHAVTNALLAAWVMLRGDWWLW